ADLRKFELIATDDRLSPEQKAAALRELTGAIGNIPESELTSAERQVLEMLRKETAAGKDAVDKSASILAASQRAAEKSRIAAASRAAEFVPFENADKATAAAEAQFPDVRELLARYYSK